MVALPIALVVSASAASGQDKPEFYRGFYGEIGGFSPLDTRMTLGIQIPGLGEEEIDLEDLGLEQEVDRFRLRGGYRFNRRHEIDFSYLSVRRSNTRSIEETFDFLGREFTAGLTLDTTIRTKDIELGYKYFIIVRPKMEFGFSTGFHFVPVDFSVDARAFLTGDFTDIELDESFVQSESLTVSLPYLGLFFDIKFFDKLYFGALWKILEVEIGDYGGNWSTYEVTLEHWTFKHVGFGVGYYFNKLEVTKENLVRDLGIAGIQSKKTGVYAYVRANI